MNRQFASTQHLFNSRGYEALDTQDDGQIATEPGDPLNEAHFGGTLKHGFSDAPRPPRKKGTKKRQAMMAEKNKQIEAAYLRYRISPSMNRNYKAVNRSGSHSHLEGGVNGTTNYTSTLQTLSSPKGKGGSFNRKGSYDPRDRVASGSPTSNNGLQSSKWNQDQIPEIVMEAPYVNKIGPGQHSFINQFD